MLYVVAALTGFRRRELQSLTRESFLIDEKPARIVCEAAYAKNGSWPISPSPKRWWPLCILGWPASRRAALCLETFPSAPV